MKRFKHTGFALTLLLLAGVILLSALLLFPHHAARAQSPQQSYDLSWWTVDGGGYTWSTGGGYTLGATIGQPDAGNLSGSGYDLCGGYWCGLRAVLYEIYLPLVTRNW